MNKRYAQMLKNQAKVKVMANSLRREQQSTVYWLALAALGSAAYIVSFFFGFTGGCAPAGD